jgi:hypothetical protein
MVVYIVGSGRWAKEIFKVCFFELKIKKIVFVSTRIKLKKWIKKLINNKKGINFIKYLPPCDSGFSKVIICNNVEKHYKSALDALNKNYQIFIEKPICQNIKQINELLEFKNRISCSKIFSFDKSLKNFSKLFKNQKIKKIFIEWNDPSIEKRYGLIKKHNKKIDYILDIFPHILNLAEIILRTDNLKFIKLIKIIQNSRNISNFIFCLNDVIFHCKVNRKKIVRKRHIKVITNKKNFVIDFSGNNYSNLKKNNRMHNAFYFKYQNKKNNLKKMLNYFLKNKKNTNILNFKYAYHYMKIYDKIFL